VSVAELSLVETLATSERRVDRAMGAVIAALSRYRVEPEDELRGLQIAVRFNADGGVKSVVITHEAVFGPASHR